MNLNALQKTQVATEFQKFAASMHLTTEQQKRLHTSLAESYTKIQVFLNERPDVSRVDVLRAVATHRDAMRQRIANFLNPTQLRTCDEEVAKASEFLGQRVES